MHDNKKQITFTEVEEFFKFRTEIVKTKTLEALYSNSVFKVFHNIKCAFSFIYLLTKENTYEKQYHSEKTNFILKDTYNRNEKWIVDTEDGEKRVLGLIVKENFVENEHHISELMLYPLNNEERTFGYIGLLNQSDEKGKFTEKDKKKLGIYARIISFVATTKKQSYKLNLVLYTIEEVRKKSGEKEMFQLLADKLVGSNMKFSGCIIHLHDKIRGNLYGKVSAGFSYEDKEESSRIEIEKDNIIGNVFVTGETTINSTSNEQFRFSDWAKKNGFKSIISIQLKNINEKPHGVLSLFTKYKYDNEYEDKDFIRNLINQTSTLINSIIDEKRIEKLKAVDSLISEIIPVKNSLQKILEIFLRRSLETLNGEFGFISLFSKNTEKITANHITALDEEKFKSLEIPKDLDLSKPNSLVSWVFLNKKPYLLGTDEKIDSMQAHYQNLSEINPVQSEILVPLMYQDEFIGVMVISSTQKHAFDFEDQDFLESIAKKTAQLIQSQRFHDASQELNNFKYKELVEEKICNETARITSKVLETGMTCIWILDENKKILRLKGTDGLEMTEKEKKRIEMKKGEGGLSWKVIEKAYENSHQPICMAFNGIQNKESKFKHASFSKDYGLKSMISVSIVIDDEIFGVINTYTKRDYMFFEHESILLKNIAIRFASALSNARLKSKHEDLLEKWTDRNTIAKPGMVALTFVHDINHYIHYLNSDLRLLDDFIPKEMKNSKAINSILDSAIKNSSLIRKSTNSLVRIGKTVKTKKKNTSLLKIMQNVEPLFNRRFDNNKITFNYPKSENSINIYCHANEMEQVFVNLTLNAIAALNSKAKGRKEIFINAYQNVFEFGRDWSKIEFMDNGIGIEKSNLENIFNTDFSTKGEEGSGFGLSICKRIVEEKHSGKIKVKSEYGEHTTFSIYLPLKK